MSRQATASKLDADDAAYQRGVEAERARCAKIADERARRCGEAAKKRAAENPKDTHSVIGERYCEQEAKLIAQEIRRG